MSANPYFDSLVNGLMYFPRQMASTFPASAQGGPQPPASPAPPVAPPPQTQQSPMVQAMQGGNVPLPTPRPPQASPPPVGAPMSLAPPSPGPMAPPQGGQQDPGLIARFLSAMHGAGGGGGGPQQQPQQTMSPMGTQPPWAQGPGGGQQPSQGLLPRAFNDLQGLGKWIGGLSASPSGAGMGTLGGSAGFGAGLG